MSTARQVGRASGNGLRADGVRLVIKEIRHGPLLWLLAFVPVVFVANALKPEAHTLLFFLSVVAIVPLAALLSRATNPWRRGPAIRSAACSTRRWET